MMEEGFGSTSRAIDSSNIGFQLLKKAGWKEGTGLGVTEQGRLEPVETHVKKNKRGIGAEKVRKKVLKKEESSSTEQTKQDNSGTKKKQKLASKRIRKMQEAEKRMQEKEFEQAFFREFWPDNV